MAADLGAHLRSLESAKAAEDAERRARFERTMDALGGPAPRSTAAAPTPPPKDDPEVVMKVEVTGVSGYYEKGAYEFAMSTRSFEITGCMSKATGADVKGSITVSLRFDREGTLQKPTLASSTFQSAEVKACILGVFSDLNPARHTINGDDTQANGRATIKLLLEKPEGF